MTKFLRHLWAWFSTIVTVLGLPGLVGDVEAWQNIIEAIGNWLREIHLPEWVLEALTKLYQIYDQIVDLLFSWLPDIFRHGAAIVIVLLGPSLFTATWNALVVQWLNARRRRNILRIGRAHGLSDRVIKFLEEEFIRDKVDKSADEMRSLVTEAAQSLASTQRSRRTQLRWVFDLEKLIAEPKTLLNLHAALSRKSMSFVDDGAVSLKLVRFVLPIMRFYLLTFFLGLVCLLERFYFNQVPVEPLVWSSVLSAILVGLVSLSAGWGRISITVGSPILLFAISALGYAAVTKSVDALVAYIVAVQILMVVCFVPLFLRRVIWRPDGS